jgi:hypothetical protein
LAGNALHHFLSSSLHHFITSNLITPMKSRFHPSPLHFIMICILHFALSSLLSHAQPSWQWANRAGGSSTELASGIATGPNGNVYVTGSYYNDTIVFGSTPLLNRGLGDVYIAAYDASGNSLWALGAGSSLDEFGADVVTDADGNVYVTGSFRSDAITLGSFLILNTDPIFGTADIFLAKLDSAGNVLWAASAGGDTTDGAYSIACDGAGNLAITGAFTSSLIYFGSHTLTNNSIANFFIAKYDSAGNVLWAHNNGNGYSWGQSIAADAAGNSIVLGILVDTAVTFGNETVYNADGLGYTPDLFIVKYDANGNVQWAQGVGGTDYDGDGSIAADAAGNVFIAGFYFSNTITIGSFVLINESTGGDDFFAAKLDPAGNVLWVNDADGYCEPTAITTDSQGNCYVTGSFNAYVTFGGDTLIEDGGLSSDVFVVKYHASGNPVWQISGGGDHYDEAWSIAVNANLDVFITGEFLGDSAVFGGTVLFNDTNNHSSDVFVCRLNGGPGTGIVKADFLSGGINLYPNPAKGILTLSGNAFAHGETVELILYDVAGKSLLEKNIEWAGKNQLRVESLTPGVYLLRISTEEESRLLKVIKE